MIKDVFNVIVSAAHKMVTNWEALLILLLSYLLLLMVSYLFFTTGEATAVQVLLSILVLPIAAIFLFFVFQAIGLSYVRIGAGPVHILKRAWQDWWKLLLVSVPLILLVWIVVYLFGKVQPAGRGNLSIVLDWARLFLLAIVFPLIAIHLWISAIGEGVAATLSREGMVRSLKRAFTPQSVLIYTVVAVVFGLIAYLLFFTRTMVGGPWTELWLFGLRLAVALSTVFLGWMLALGSMAEFTARETARDVEP